jgi:site-specific recombinase xerD
MRYTFTGAFAPHICGLIEKKQALGYDYHGSACILQTFDKFCREQFPNETCLTAELAMKWAEKSKTEQNLSRLNRVSVIRELAKHMNSVGEQAYLLPLQLTKKTGRHIPYIYSKEDLSKLFKEIDSLQPSLRAPTKHLVVSVIFRMIYCCGLRPIEARRLRRKDVNLFNGTVNILESKGHKDRIVVLSEDTLNLFKSSAIILAIRFQHGRRRMKTADFAAHLTEFLSHYLPELKNISTNTISSYCDAFRLFLGYCQDVEGMRIEKLSIDDLTPELVDHFLQWLRIERNNGTATRSQRLAAIRSFVKYLQIKEPRLLLNFQQILAIPVKRAERKAINPLTKEAIALILRQPDTSTLSGRRDATILCFLYDTAARVQEICDLRIEDVRLDYPASVKILGKGRKTRVVPILPATAQNLKKYLTEMHMLAPEKSHLPLFMNRNGQKLTRAGVTYILNKYAKAASVIDPSIPEKIPPHLMRHTKAMHIYDADNDLVHVRDFLGHSDIKTTDIYARSSLTMKQKALERVSDSPVPSMPSWQKSRSTMEWLKSFGSQKA